MSPTLTHIRLIVMQAKISALSLKLGVINKRLSRVEVRSDASEKLRVSIGGWVVRPGPELDMWGSAT
eukprot:362835-Chlamydomonas_euryale.AAC.8